MFKFWIDLPSYVSYIQEHKINEQCRVSARSGIESQVTQPKI